MTPDARPPSVTSHPTPVYAPHPDVQQSAAGPAMPARPSDRGDADSPDGSDGPDDPVSPDSPEGPDSDMSVAGEEDPGSALDVTPHSSR